MTDRNGIVLRFIPRVPHRTRAAMRRLVAIAPKVVKIRHRMAVYVAPAVVVECPNGKVGFGAFCSCGGLPEIWMGGRPPTRWVEAWLREVLAHELAHYEQFRDKRRLTERGVRRREKTLVRLFKREAAK